MQQHDIENAKSMLRVCEIDNNPSYLIGNTPFLMQFIMYSMSYVHSKNYSSEIMYLIGETWEKKKIGQRQ